MYTKTVSSITFEIFHKVCFAPPTLRVVFTPSTSIAWSNILLKTIFKFFLLYICYFYLLFFFYYFLFHSSTFIKIGDLGFDVFHWVSNSLLRRENALQRLIHRANSTSWSFTFLSFSLRFIKEEQKKRRTLSSNVE